MWDKGSQRGVYRYLATLEPSAQRSSASSRVRKASRARSNPLRTISVRKATWLLFRKPDELKAEERENLRLIRPADPRVETAYQLVETFLRDGYVSGQENTSTLGSKR
jgi:hypothetical protein